MCAHKLLLVSFLFSADEEEEEEEDVMMSPCPHSAVSSGAPASLSPNVRAYARKLHF